MSQIQRNFQIVAPIHPQCYSCMQRCPKVVQLTEPYLPTVAGYRSFQICESCLRAALATVGACA